MIYDINKVHLCYSRKYDLIIIVYSYNYSKFLNNLNIRILAREFFPYDDKFDYMSTFELVYFRDNLVKFDNNTQLIMFIIA